MLQLHFVMQKVGEVKKSGRVHRREEMSLFFYHLIFVSKAYIPNLGPLGPPILTRDTYPGGGGVGGQLRLYSLAQPSYAGAFAELGNIFNFAVCKIDLATIQGLSTATMLKTPRRKK